MKYDEVYLLGICYENLNIMNLADHLKESSIWPIILVSILTIDGHMYI